MGTTITPDKEEKNAFKRTTTINGKTVELRVVTPSGEAIKALGMRSKRTIVAPIAVNPPSKEKHFAMEKANLLRSIARMSPVIRNAYLKSKAPFDFVKDKQKRGYRQYAVNCVKCGDQVATVWATDSTLKDWCDLHYVCWHDEHTWYGAMEVQVSLIDEQLGFECACGEDTRDFRTAKSMSPVLRELAANYSMKHREFNKPTSAFLVTKL
jgi:hypothetical protein